MLCIVAALTVAGGLAQAPIEIREGRIVTRVVEGGRNPFPKDALVAELVQAGPAYDPATSKLAWRDAKASGEGWFEGINAGYLWTTFDSLKEQPMVLEATGQGMVYINGEPRGGDPYAYGYVKLPFLAKAGKNSLLFSGGRGRVKARVVAPKAEAQFEAADLTLPDVLSTDKGNLFGALVVLNNTGSTAKDLTIEASAGGKTALRTVSAIGPFTFRKVRFDFPAFKTGDKIQLTLKRGGKALDSATLPVRVKEPNVHYNRTFVSSIDGSVQYYAVAPALKPSKSNGLVLSLHGASVEAAGQAAAYKLKDWETLVAATNRRPYGFDWEDWGRLDAMEVLGIAEKTIPHDPNRVFLTGHSMGGHGTWSIGTMFPGRFAAIAPSAGWVSFWSYAGGWEPRDPNAVERLLRSSMNPSDTLQRVRNLSDLGVYILHGDADDNVPVGQARAMREVLKPWHKDLGYHEQPGAEHWWGNECVDWPGIFELFERRKIEPEAETVEFVTQNPAISDTYKWVTVVQPILWSAPSSIKATRRFVDGKLTVDVVTKNVAAFTVYPPETKFLTHESVTVDGRKAVVDVEGVPFFSSLTLTRLAGSWYSGAVPASQKSDKRAGPFKQAFTNNMVFVYGTKGRPDENAWSYAKARFDAETFYYRGNGSIDVVSDAEANRMRLDDRNVILFGNMEVNGMYDKLLTNVPEHFGVFRGGIGAGGKMVGGEAAAIFLRPGKGEKQLIGILAGTGMVGNRLLDRLPVFTSGVSFPDWVVFDPKVTTEGTKAVLAAGFFGNDWSIKTGQTARRD